MEVRQPRQMSVPQRRPPRRDSGTSSLPWRGSIGSASRLETAPERRVPLRVRTSEPRVSAASATPPHGRGNSLHIPASPSSAMFSVQTAVGSVTFPTAGPGMLQSAGLQQFPNPPQVGAIHLGSQSTNGHAGLFSPIKQQLDNSSAGVFAALENAAPVFGEPVVHTGQLQVQPLPAFTQSLGSVQGSQRPSIGSLGSGAGRGFAQAQTLPFTFMGAAGTLSPAGPGHQHFSPVPNPGPTVPLQWPTF